MEDKADLFVKPYLVNPLCFRKKKWKQSELIFHIQREARLISQNPLTLPTSPLLPNALSSCPILVFAAG